MTSQSHEEFKKSMMSLFNDESDLSPEQPEQSETSFEENQEITAFRKLKQERKSLKRKKASLELWDSSLVKSEYDNEERHSRRESALSPMLEEKSRKLLVEVNRKTFLALTLLCKKFPNFSHVIARYEDSLRLRSLGKVATVWLPPIVLVGPPGIGKTRFLRELATALMIDFFSVDMSTTSAGFILNGGNSSWSNGRPGFVSNSLRKSKVANPLFLADEIDKAGGDDRYDPISCFYLLLEKHTAKEFQDECLEIPMDCSAINWVASANYIDRIPAPILSRMDVIEVQPPTLEQMPVIVQSLFTELLQSNDWGERFIDNLSKDVLSEMTVCTPREMGKVLEKSCANAAKRKGGAKGQIRLITKDIELPNDISSRRIGF